MMSEIRFQHSFTNRTIIHFLGLRNTILIGLIAIISRQDTARPEDVTEIYTIKDQDYQDYDNILELFF